MEKQVVSVKLYGMLSLEHETLCNCGVFQCDCASWTADLDVDVTFPEEPRVVSGKVAVSPSCACSGVTREYDISETGPVVLVSGNTIDLMPKVMQLLREEGIIR